MKEIKENNYLNMAFNSQEDIQKEIKQEEREKAKGKSKSFYSEISQLTYDYIDFKCKVQGKLKKDIIEEIIENDMKKAFELPDNATEKELELALESKKKVFENMKNIFK